ncbi:MAG: methyltransferase domain-containing protein [Syntrophorhabdales bacterium]|jgi:ubiquinone/menaquinone biosynthesis C-methylase UbiE
MYPNVRYTYDPARSGVWREICHYLQSYLPNQAVTLDLGAGYCDFSRHLIADKKYALDIDSAFLQYWPDDVKPLLQSALEPFPLDDSSISVVLASNFFEHFLIDECRTVLMQVHRVLQNDGLLIAIQPNIRLQPGRYYDDYTHTTPFTEASFCDFLQSLGWKIIRCEGRFLPFTMKSRFPKPQWLVRRYLALPYRPWAGQFLVIARKIQHV